MSSSAVGETRTPSNLRALATASRPQNLALAGIGTVTGALAGGAPVEQAAHLWPFLAAALVGATGTAGGNLLNDLMDIELDRQAHPERPLPSGRLRPRTAWVAVLLLFTLAVALAFAFSLGAGLLALALVALLLVYETRLKRSGLPGNLGVAVAAGALFPLGALIARADVAAPVILGVIAALAHLGRELLKDAEDAAADAAAGRRTLAVTHGPQTAARLAAGPLLVAILLSPLGVILLDWHPLYLGLVAPAVVLFLLAAAIGMRDPRRGQRLAKAAMVAALAAFLLAARIPPGPLL